MLGTFEPFQGMLAEIQYGQTRRHVVDDELRSLP